MIPGTTYSVRMCVWCLRGLKWTTKPSEVVVFCTYAIHRLRASVKEPIQVAHGYERDILIT